MKKDVIIIGAGIAGLYSAYLIKKKHPEWNLLVLEKEGKIGGRMGTEMFYGTPIAIGAGIGRKKKDNVLIALANELHIHTNDFIMEMDDKSKDPISVSKVIKQLRNQYRKHPQKTTFENFARKELGKENYERFIVSAGYTDYEKEDVYETLYHYGMEDNESGWTGFVISWNELLMSLVHHINMKNIKLNSEVKSIHKLEDGFEVVTDKQSWSTDKIIVATTVDSIHRLLKTEQKSLYQKIHGQPFLRVYGKFDKKSTEIMKQYVPKHSFVNGPLHRIIPMDAEKGVYMIAYTDNKGAMTLKKYTDNSIENKNIFCHLIENAFGIKKDTLHLIALKSYFWKTGTHYYEPLDTGSRPQFIKKNQHPCENVWIVGEAVSRNQGWVEGALESVEAVREEWV